MHRITSSSTHMPTKPGVYVMGHDVTYEGLETFREYVYIGQTTNLQRRFKQHSLLQEEKPGLRAYIRKHLKKVKFWYTTEVDPNQLHRLERQLIRKFKPKFNDTL